MNLRRQLLIVSLTTLVLPWAGCQFIRETERALRTGQKDMLAGTALALADALSQYPEEFPLDYARDYRVGAPLYGHRLEYAPSIDGYVEDWPIDARSIARFEGVRGPFALVAGLHGGYLYLFVAVTDADIAYLAPGAGPAELAANRPLAERVELVSVSPPYLDERFLFGAEAPGRIVAYARSAQGIAPQAGVFAHWEQVPGGYQLEAQIPQRLLGTNLGVTVTDAATDGAAVASASSFATPLPGPLMRPSEELRDIAAGLVQRGMRLYITDREGWQLAATGSLDARDEAQSTGVTAWLRRFYGLLVDEGTAAALAAPAASGRERQAYVRQALDGEVGASWFRSEGDGSAIVAVAQPVVDGGGVIGAVVLQRGTDAILSLTNDGLARLLNLTLITTIGIALGLLGYASWLSRRIRRLSVAAEAALVDLGSAVELPSADAGDELGDLSRSFANVLGALGEYNAYLRTLASKLSHELRTPLAIVTSSLNNLEHEALGQAAKDYTRRATDGAERLRRILNAMSEASRVEELMHNAEFARFDVDPVLEAAVGAYRDAYPERRFEYRGAAAAIAGAPELLIQMLDKLVDNAVSFSAVGDRIELLLERRGDSVCVSVENPGPPLPERFRQRLFDSLVSVRAGGGDRHLGLGLYVARLIVEGHGGRIDAENTAQGVRFTVSLPACTDGGLRRPGSGQCSSPPHGPRRPR